MESIMSHTILESYINSQWKGKGELWLDPAGNDAILYDCEMNIEKDVCHYCWIYEGEKQQGSYTFKEGLNTWTDTWHQPDSSQCKLTDDWGIFTLKHEYEVPENPTWGWMSRLSERPDGTLVLQMTNIAPWGEDGRAVRMIFEKIEA